MRWLVFGANGQLGQDLLEILPIAGHEVIGMDLPQVDITETASVVAALVSHMPDVVVNAAAFTAVDDAETNESLALRVNGVGPGVIAEALIGMPGVRFVQVSTDYVFDGSARSPYQEETPTCASSAYGRTKAVGEEEVLRKLPQNGYVVRTAWLYSAHGSNFVKTMLRLARERDTVDVVADQYGQPTWSRDLAAQIEALVCSGAPAGVFHGTSSGATTWYEFARQIFQLAGYDPQRVHPTTTDRFPRPAPRPAYSVLGHAKWESVGIPPIRDWEHALADALPLILASEQA